jgi:hypothetical protein
MIQKCKWEISEINNSQMLLSSFIVVLGGSTLWHLKRFVQFIKCIILNSPPSLLSFILPSPDSWNSFKIYYFCTYIHVYTPFAPYLPSYHLSPPPPPSHWCHPYFYPTESSLPSCSSIL